MYEGTEICIAFLLGGEREGLKGFGQFRREWGGMRSRIWNRGGFDMGWRRMSMNLLIEVCALCNEVLLDWYWYVLICSLFEEDLN